MIRADGLGKAYMIGHAVERDRYVALRDVLAGAARAAIGRIRDPARGPGVSGGESIEAFWALKDVSFEVRRGEVLGIVGRNGAGKSTLLKVLSRITEPTRGRVEIRGRLASLLEVGTGFHPELSGRENIFLNGAILGMTRAEIRRKFDEIVAFAEVEKFLDTPVKRYSSGMYVRLAFAVAAHLEPEILVVDEVLSVGDAEFQKKCLGKMQDVAGHGRTVLFVSHNLSSVRSLCNRATMLDRGRVAYNGGVEDTLANYLAEMKTTHMACDDLGARPREGHFGERGRILGVKINSDQALAHGLPAEFEISYSVQSPIEGIAFSLGFSTPDGAKVMCIDTDIPGPRFRLRPTKQSKVRVSIDRMHLAPTEYILSAAIRSGDNFLIDYIPDALSVTVMPSAKTPAVIALRTTGHGGVRYPCSTEVNVPASLNDAVRNDQ